MPFLRMISGGYEHPVEVPELPLSVDAFLKHLGGSGFDIIREGRRECLINGEPIWFDTNLHEGDRVEIKLPGELRCPRCNSRFMFDACQCRSLQELRQGYQTDTSIAQDKWMRARLKGETTDLRWRESVNNRMGLLLIDPEDSGT